MDVLQKGSWQGVLHGAAQQLGEASTFPLEDRRGERWRCHRVGRLWGGRSGTELGKGKDTVLLWRSKKLSSWRGRLSFSPLPPSQLVWNFIPVLALLLPPSPAQALFGEPKLQFSHACGVVFLLERAVLDSAPCVTSCVGKQDEKRSKLKTTQKKKQTRRMSRYLERG